jgi:hypothetical protein
LKAVCNKLNIICSLLEWYKDFLSKSRLNARKKYKGDSRYVTAAWSNEDHPDIW